ncbi:hypothetical protein CRENBAI_020545 [Crenichthys baileyi]|uniref:Uncharacterized protein n=1 Tax=Crenichthys baileyi TaxID=28760 RepID=A0AAV9QUK7_9TELE
MVREFKRGEIPVKLFSHLVTSPSSPWRRLEIAGSLQDWLEARRDFFPDPRIHHTIEAQRQRALGEIAASMRRPPAPSSARLSTEAGGGFHVSWMNRLHIPILFLVLFRRGPKPSHPHTLLLSVWGSWMDCLHSLLLLLFLFPVLSWRAPRTNCLHPWFPFRRSSWRTCLYFLFLSLRGTRTHPLLCLGGSAADLQGLAEGPSCLRTAPLSSTVGSPGPAAGRQIIGSYVTGLLVACPYATGLLIACPYVAGLLIVCPYVAGVGPFVCYYIPQYGLLPQLPAGIAADRKGRRSSDVTVDYIRNMRPLPFPHWKPRPVTTQRRNASFWRRNSHSIADGPSYFSPFAKGGRPTVFEFVTDVEQLPPPSRSLCSREDDTK